MENKDLRDQLLAQQSPRPDKLANYRKEIKIMLEENDKKLNRHKWRANTTWIIYILVTMFLFTYAGPIDQPRAAFMAALSSYFLLTGAVFLLEYFIHRSQIGVLKELKQVELQVLELREMLQKQNPR
jgi:hypothetical protein